MILAELRIELLLLARYSPMLTIGELTLVRVKTVHRWHMVRCQDVPLRELLISMVLRSILSIELLNLFGLALTIDDVVMIVHNHAMYLLVFFFNEWSQARTWLHLRGYFSVLMEILYRF